MYGYVYKTTNNLNNKIYIGQHKSSVFDDKYIGSGKILLQAITKYGKDNFTTEVLEWCDSREQLNEKEIHYINKYNSTNNNIGYNICKGGNGGDVFSTLPAEHQLQLREQFSKSIKNKICINNGIHNKYIMESDIVNYIQKGWQLGSIKSISTDTKNKLKDKLCNRVTVTNGVVNKHIYESELQDYISNGFHMGYTKPPKFNEYQETCRAQKQQESIQQLQIWLDSKPLCATCGCVMTYKYGTGKFCSKKCASTHKHTAETKQLISMLNKQGICGTKGKVLSEEHKKQISESLKTHYAEKYVWVTNGEITKKIKETELHIYEKCGYKKGRKTKTSQFTAWNKGLDINDNRVKRNIEHRNKTMLERYGTLDGNKFKQTIR